MPERYSWDDGSDQQDDPWGSLRTLGGGSDPDRAPTNHTLGAPSWDPRTGMGTPESGYGPDGVNNPAYTGIGSPNYLPLGGAPDPNGRGGAPPPSTPTKPVAPAGGRSGLKQPPNGDWRGWFMGLTQGKAPSPKTLDAMEADLGAYGVKLLRNGRGFADKIQLPDGTSYDVIEAATANGGRAWAWMPDAATVDGQARGLMSSLSGDGHDVKSDGLNALIVDGRRYLVNEPTRPTWQSSFEGKAPYTPTEIGMEDLAGLGYQDVLSRLKTPVAGATSDLMLSILKNPESLSDHMVETLKAKSADELAEMARADENELTRFGFANNIADSNWLASERRAGQQARDKALIGSNRYIDITAAQTRLEDRRKAATLGTQYQGEERAREGLAADVGLRKAAETKDRLALNEQFKQKAAELQIDVDQLKLQYTQSLMEDITKRYGIRVAADVDWARLSMQSQQFQDDLIFKMHELDQKMQLGYDELQFDYTSDTLNRDQRERFALEDK